MNASARLEGLVAAIESRPQRVVACSGGVDSMLLADIAHGLAGGATIVAHSVTPAVPPTATARVREAADLLGWDLLLVRSNEFDDPRYVANPPNRCFFCKENLYQEIERVISATHGLSWPVMSGANTDDLAEYRPGLAAAADHQVAHPYVEAQIDKETIRAMARARGREWSELPASPCLASRLYTGTPVHADVLRSIDQGESFIKNRLPISVVRCRVRGTEVLVEALAPDRELISDDLLSELLVEMRKFDPTLTSAELDGEPYAPGRSFIRLDSIGRSADLRSARG